MLKKDYRAACAAGVTSAVAMLSPVASADWELNMPRGVTTITNLVYSLHMLAS